MLNTELFQNPDGISYFGRAISFIKMKPSRHGHYLFSAQPAKYQLSMMSFNCRNWKMRNIIISYLCLGLYVIYEVSEAAAQYNSHFRANTRSLQNIFRGLFDFLNNL